MSKIHISHRRYKKLMNVANKHYKKSEISSEGFMATSCNILNQRPLFNYRSRVN